MAEPIRRITILGGGTAGWMTALMLQNAFRTDPGAPDAIDLTLIESPNVATVGVGEATVPGMPRTLRQSGISEAEFFRTCNASFKLGVLFGHWNEDGDGKPIDWINPFTHGRPIDGIPIADYFHHFGASGRDYVQVYSPSAALAKHFKGPRPLRAPEYDDRLGFAYHLDAGRFAGMLQGICTARGIRHIRDDMVDTVRDERGHIAALTLKDNGDHPLDLVIDCTGFRGLLINGAMGEPFEDYAQYLANDRALAVQIPKTTGRIEPLTRSTALGAGWSWRVPLYNRIGTGYVFSSAYRTDEAARDEFLAHLGPDAKGLDPRVIPMRVGKTRNAWAGNCIAIGLSGGFIEPLESTAIFMIEMGVRWLLDNFPDKGFAPPLRDQYNRLSNSLYDEVRDFICLHYRLGNRTDSQYWIDARESLTIPDSLATKLDLWRHKLPSTNDLGSYHLFGPWAHQAALLGKQVYGTDYGPGPTLTGRRLDRGKWAKYLVDQAAREKVMLGAVADHRALLTQMRGQGAEAAQAQMPDHAIL